MDGNLDGINKVFFPLNISYVQSQKKTSRILRIIFGVVITIILEIVAIVLYNKNRYLNIIGTIPALIFMLIVGFWIGVLFINLFGIEVLKVIKIYNEAKDHQITTIQDMYNVNTIEKGKMYCYDQSVRMFIKCERGYILNRSEADFQDHQVALGQFLGTLLSNDYEVTLYNLCIENSNMEPLQNTERNLKNLVNPDLQKIGHDFIKYYRTCLGGMGKSIEDYYVVSAKDNNLQAHIQSVCSRAINILKSNSLYLDVHICDEQEIIQLNEQLLKIKGINAKELRFGGELTPNSNVVRLVAFYDANGTRYTKEDIDKLQDKYESESKKQEQKEQKKLKLEQKKLLAEMEAMQAAFTAGISSTNLNEDDEVVPIIEDDDFAPVIIDETDTQDSIIEEEGDIITQLDNIFYGTVSSPQTPDNSLQEQLEQLMSDCEDEEEL